MTGAVHGVVLVVAAACSSSNGTGGGEYHWLVQPLMCYVCLASLEHGIASHHF